MSHVTHKNDASITQIQYVVTYIYFFILFSQPSSGQRHCNTLQRTATQCSMLQYSVTYQANHLWDTVAATHCKTLQGTATHCNALQRTATHCNTLQRSSTHCYTLQRIAPRCNTLQHTAIYQANHVKGTVTATQGITLQHAATHYCNIPGQPS